MSWRAGLGALALALLAWLALAAPAADAKKGGGKVDITKVANAPIPTLANAQEGILRSVIDVPNRFKGKRIRDVNVTVQTLATSGTTPGDDLTGKLTAPNGATSELFDDLDGFGPGTEMSIGPLTLDDEALLDLGDGTPDNPTELFSPWMGTTAPGVTPLWPLDGGRVTGAWTLIITDDSTTGTSNLVSWRLTVVAGRPFQTK
jgi:hypothetical protein